MNRRGFVGATLAGIGGLFFPQKVKADADSFELDGCLIQRITPVVTNWNRDSNGNRWIDKALIGTWMITYINVDGIVESMIGSKQYPHRTPKEALHSSVSRRKSV